MATSVLRGESRFKASIATWSVVRATLLPQLITVLVVILAWAATSSWVSSPLLFPSPLDIWINVAEMARSGELASNVGATLRRLMVGLLVGAPFGALIGCAMGRWFAIDALLNPFARFFNSIPAIALVPFSLLWFGVSETGRYALVTYTVFLTILLSARQGVRSVSALRLKAGAVLGVVGASAFLRIVVPSCFPAILAGTRTAIGLGVMVTVAAEMLGAESGLGYLILQALSQFNMGHVFVGVIGLGLIALGLDRIFQATIEWLLPRWSFRRRVR